MKFSKWLDKRIAKLHWCHIALVKLSVASFALFIAKIWPPILSLDAIWYFLLALVFGYLPIYRFYCAK